MGHSPTLLSRLAVLEKEIAVTAQRIEAHKAPEISVRVEEIREFVTSNIADIRSLLQDRPARVKQELTKQIGSLTLMPKNTPNGGIYEVSGNWNLLPNKDVIELVARDGIEPPTPAFSERNFQVISTTYKVLKDRLNTWKYVLDGFKPGGDNG